METIQPRSDIATGYSYYFNVWISMETNLSYGQIVIIAFWSPLPPESPLEAGAIGVEEWAVMALYLLACYGSDRLGLQAFELFIALTAARAYRSPSYLSHSSHNIGFLIAGILLSAIIVIICFLLSWRRLYHLPWRKKSCYLGTSRIRGRIKWPPVFKLPT